MARGHQYGTREDRMSSGLFLFVLEKSATSGVDSSAGLFGAKLRRNYRREYHHEADDCDCRMKEKLVKLDIEMQRLAAMEKAMLASPDS